MSPATRAALGLCPLPPQQAARVQAQHAALCAGMGPRWPEGMASINAPTRPRHLYRLELHKPQRVLAEAVAHNSARNAANSLTRLLRRCGTEGMVVVLRNGVEIAPQQLRDAANQGTP